MPFLSQCAYTFRLLFLQQRAREKESKISFAETFSPKRLSFLWSGDTSVSTSAINACVTAVPGP